MDQKFRTSFIPKQEVIRTEAPPTSFRFSVFSIIAIGLFGFSVILALTVFIYQRVMISTLDKMTAELVATRSSFEPSFIDSMIKLDRRIEAGKQVLTAHNALGPVLALLENQTLKGIRYKNFEYTYGTNGKMGMNMTGEARDFLTIASQSELWSGEHRIIDPIFNNLNLDDKNLAKFSFKSSLDSALFLYKNSFKAASSTPSSVQSDNVNNVDSEIKITPINSDAGGILPSEI